MDEPMTREALTQRIAELKAELKALRSESSSAYASDTGCLEDLDLAADGICVCHAINDFPYVRFTLWNRRMVDLTGYGIDEINRKGWYQSVYPDPEIQARGAERLTRVMTGDKQEAESWEITCADGTRRTLSIFTTILDPTHRFPRVMFIMHDATAARPAKSLPHQDQNAERLADAERALKISDARYRTLFDAASDAIFIENDRDEIIDVNRQACELLGYTREELLSMKVCDIQAPECRGEPGKILNGEMSTYQGQPFETLDLHKDGSHIPVEVTNTRLDEAGLFLSIVRDISERKAHERAYRETFDIIEKSPVVAFLWRNETDWPVEFVTTNVAHIFGYSNVDFLSGGVCYSKVVHPDDLDRVAGEVAAFSQDPNRSEFDHEPYRIVARDGEIRWINDSTFIRRDTTGVITHYQGIVTDVTDQIRAEAALRHSEDEKRTILDSLKELVIYTDAHMKIVWANKAACESLDLPREVLIGRTCHSFWGKSPDPCPGCVVVPAMESGRIQEAEVQTPDGRVWFNQGHPVFDENGVVTGGIETCLEITAHKEAEAALQESEARFRQIASAIREVFWLFDWQEQRVLYVNPAYELIWGRSRDALYERYDEWAQSIHPDDVDHAETTFNRILETGGGEAREYRILRPDGTVRWISDTGYVIKDENDRVLRITGIAEDVTDRKEAEEALSREKEHLAVTLRSIGDAVITTDRDGRIVLMNSIAEQLTGWSEADAVDRRFVDVFRIEDERTGEPCESPIDKVLATGQIVGLANHTVLIARDGQRYTIADSGAPILDLEGEIIGVVLVFRDITAQQRTEAELLKMEKLKSIGVLAGGIAHDFNNFLTGIIGNLSLAKLDAPSGSPVMRYLGDMEKAAMRAKELTQQLLTFSKGGEPVKRTTSIAELVREAVQFALHGSNVRCRLDIDAELMAADVDEGQIAQVIHNLIINADQAMPDGGTVRIRGANVSLAQGNPFALLPGDYTQVAVQDQGMGIHPDHLSKVFDPYFTTKQKGSGLGLAVAYNIIAKHDGQMTVESILGAGTTFTILLPATTSGPLTDNGKYEAIVTGQGRILVMDDEDYIRKLALAMLTKLGYEVVVATDGQAALELYRNAIFEGRPFDAVILDLTIPGGMGGKEAIKRLIEMDQNVRAIVSSGYSNDPVMANYTRYGFSGAVKKPYLVQEMSQILGSIIKK